MVAEKTGYPVEMLELSMGLDADLGIDSIKRVEILSALEESLPGLNALEPDQLGELETLQQVVDALASRRLRRAQLRHPRWCRRQSASQAEAPSSEGAAPVGRRRRPDVAARGCGHRVELRHDRSGAGRCRSLSGKAGQVQRSDRTPFTSCQAPESGLPTAWTPWARLL